MSHEEATLAVLLRQTQWLLDDVAHDLPAGRVTPDKGEELAGILESLAALVRKQTVKRPASVPLDYSGSLPDAVGDEVSTERRPVGAEWSEKILGRRGSGMCSRWGSFVRCSPPSW
jgi:hypothetical protein